MSPLALVADRPADRPAATCSPPAGAKYILSAADASRVHAAFVGRMAEDLDAGADLEPALRGVLFDVLAHPGSLLRAQLAFDIQLRHAIEPEAALDLGVAIEYFHTASLLFDDLPSMDDGTERRGRPCPHKVWGEAAAQLGALALITRAYQLLWRSLAALPQARSRRATELVGACLGARGILDGQARDLHPPRAWSAADVTKVAEGKTVTLIRLSLVLPALVAGAPDRELAELDMLSRSWGLAYQVIDDFKDHLLSAEESGKTPHRDRALHRPNLPAVLGADAALVDLRSHLDNAAGCVARLESANQETTLGRWQRLTAVQHILETDFDDIAVRLNLPVCA